MQMHTYDVMVFYIVRPQIKKAGIQSQGNTDGFAQQPDRIIALAFNVRDQALKRCASAKSKHVPLF